MEATRHSPGEASSTYADYDALMDAGKGGGEVGCPRNGGAVGMVGIEHRELVGELDVDVLGGVAVDVVGLGGPRGGNEAGVESEEGFVGVAGDSDAHVGQCACAGVGAIHMEDVPGLVSGLEGAAELERVGESREPKAFEAVGRTVGEVEGSAAVVSLGVVGVVVVIW